MHYQNGVVPCRRREPDYLGILDTSLPVHSSKYEISNAWWTALNLDLSPSRLLRHSKCSRFRIKYIPFEIRAMKLLDLSRSYPMYIPRQCCARCLHVEARRDTRKERGPCRRSYILEQIRISRGRRTINPTRHRIRCTVRQTPASVV
jgi:hypothetical protein